MPHIHPVGRVHFLQDDEAVFVEAVPRVLQGRQLAVWRQVMKHIVENDGARAAGPVAEKGARVKLGPVIGPARNRCADFVRVKIDSDEARPRKPAGQQVGQQAFAAAKIEHDTGAVEQPHEQPAGIKRLLEDDSAQADPGLGIVSGEGVIKHRERTEDSWVPVDSPH